MGQPSLYGSDAGFDVGEGRVLGGLGADVDLGVVGVAMEVQVEIANYVAKGEEVADEKEGTEN